MVALEGGTDTPAPFHSALDGKDLDMLNGTSSSREYITFNAS